MTTVHDDAAVTATTEIRRVDDRLDAVVYRGAATSMTVRFGRQSRLAAPLTRVYMAPVVLACVIYRESVDPERSQVQSERGLLQVALYGHNLVHNSEKVAFTLTFRRGLVDGLASDDATCQCADTIDKLTSSLLSIASSIGPCVRVCGGGAA